jgi:hypothetical protein
MSDDPIRFGGFAHDLLSGRLTKQLNQAAREAHDAYAEAHAQAEGAQAARDHLASEVERLRGLIRAVVAKAPTVEKCWCSSEYALRKAHPETCIHGTPEWAALVAEAEKP